MAAYAVNYKTPAGALRVLTGRKYTARSSAQGIEAEILFSWSEATRIKIGAESPVPSLAHAREGDAPIGFYQRSLKISAAHDGRGWPCLAGEAEILTNPREVLIGLLQSMMSYFLIIQRITEFNAAML